MRPLIIAIAALSLAGAGQSFAQAGQAATAAPVYAANPAKPTHEECKAVMGHKMDPAVAHDHGSMKGVPTATPHRKPLSKAQMERMHAKCAARMAKTAETPK